MKRKLLLLISGSTALIAVACSVLGGGQTNPILSKLVPGTLSDYGPTLAGNCTESCNVDACREYNANMVICLNPVGFTSQLPGNPFVTQAQIASAIAAVCNTNQYLPTSPPNAVAGGCVYPSPSATPAASLRHRE